MKNMFILFEIETAYDIFVNEETVAAVKRTCSS
jgi:hypothetical protein